jgi:organic hydroperoxide reductase OsmC/OhrA
MSRTHHYTTALEWTGNLSSGTSSYTAYGREHTISVQGKPDVFASSDPAFRGNAARHNPEELLVASLSSCHMLWYLHLCADAGVIVIAYTDEAKGIMEESSSGGRFTEVMLHPKVTVAKAGMIDKANALHDEAHRMCFIANSCNFPVRHLPECEAME